MSGLRIHHGSGHLTYGLIGISVSTAPRKSYARRHCFARMCGSEPPLPFVPQSLARSHANLFLMGAFNAACVPVFGTLMHPHQSLFELSEGDRIFPTSVRSGLEMAQAVDRDCQKRLFGDAVYASFLDWTVLERNKAFFSGAIGRWITTGGVPINAVLVTGSALPRFVQDGDLQLVV
jgi:hypothetical protein